MYTSKLKGVVPVWGIVLQQGSEVSLARQIFAALKTSILTGQLPAGEALPSTRALAKGLGICRNNVVEAYDMLWAEGFLVRHQGAPSRVAPGLHLTPSPATAAPPPAQPAPPPILWDFKTGQPDLSLFPLAAWNKTVAEAARTLQPDVLCYSGPQGYAPLREEIAHWLLRSKSMVVDPQDIFITGGATQALYLLVTILHRQGRAFALESPSHPAVRTVLADGNYPFYPVPVDQAGADIATLQNKAVSAVYITPSHQFPLGGILPAARRAALVRMATENDFYIIEDDYDSEFRYSGNPISPVYAMCPARVAYVGSFSKTLFPALRLGFAVLPKTLQEAWRHYRTFMDVQNPVLEQAALAAFLQQRKMDRHVQKMRRAYSEKRALLLGALQSEFGTAAQPWGDASGLHLALQLPGAHFGPRFTAACRAAGVRVTTVAQYCPVPNEHGDKLLLGYGHLAPDQITNGVAALHRVVTAAAYLPEDKT